MSFKNRIKSIIGIACKIIILIAIPLILYKSSVFTIKEKGDSWYKGGYDPEYAYLFNSMNIATFKVPGHVDHPGTTMQVVGGVILKFSWLMDPTESKSFQESVLSNPEYYINILNNAVMIIGCLIIFILGYIILSATGNIWLSLLIQITPFLSGIILFNGFTRLTQECMLMISAISMAAATIVWYFSEHTNTRKIVIVFAIISAFGIASKVTFIPILLIPLILLKGYKTKVKYIWATFLAFIIITIPIIKMYPHMLKWIGDLFMHSGIYGSGKATVVDPNTYFSTLLLLITSEPVYLTIFCITGLMIIFFKFISKNVKHTKLTILLSALFTTQLLGFIIIAKHPKVAYLLPYICLSGANLALIVHSFFYYSSNKYIKIYLQPIITILICAFLVSSGLRAKHKLYGSERNAENSETWTKANEGMDFAVIGGNPGPSPIAALFFGNAYSHNRYSKLLNKLYPNYYIYDSYIKSFVNWERKEVDINMLMKRYTQVKSVAFESMGNELTEKLRSNYSGNLNTFILKSESVDLRVFTKSENLENTFLTQSKNPYAFAKVINVYAGDKIFAKVLVKGDPKNSKIVISGNNSQEYYEAFEPNLPYTDDWNEIVLNTEIKKNLSDGKVKIYCWNSGEKEVIFKDFQLTIK